VAKLILSEVDRAKYDLPAEVEYVSGQWGFKAVAAMEKVSGYTYDRVLAGLRGIIAHDEDGAEYRKFDLLAWVAFAWMILWDAGHRIPWDDFDLHAVPDLISDEEPEPEGKAPDPDTSSATTTIPD
jgi:hypothetical protein